ncbi:pilus motility taxis protein HmpF [Anabaena cylindrica UHCC 0172]|uniref:pilus motility taxis protein HmpF n=1 Tax=Anabaena cylindrica TaxID=1165 RepID=UPI002B208370|nr:pilus motility taxis protein HmpF [Anabaena cylindrica]MEA5552737.1 pilus motility taxis protein HmpF [Anabaena cylindrica UHCC 0172]
MLYLAEVQKQKGGLLSGGSKTELKLLACQRSDQNWNTVSEETITAEEAGKLNDGALVLVELSPNRQVQRIQEAGRPLVNILQNFSRQMEKFKLKEDEIDQWKQSLMFQVQELNRREMDMESRLEQLQQLENDVQRLETQKHEVETSREQIEQLQAEVERNRQELEGAWEHLRGEQRRLDEIKTDAPQGSVLGEEQSQLIADLLKRLSTNDVSATGTLQEDLKCAFELIEQQQATLNPHWQQLESQLTLAHQQQEEVEQISQTLRDRQTEILSLEQQLVQFQLTTATLKNKEDFSAILKQQLQNQEDLYQQTQTLVATAGNIAVEQQVDVEALQTIPLEELQKMVAEDQEKLHQDSIFVQEQEQELNYKQESIEELQTKIQQASEEDSKNLEAELADEELLYQMLNDSLEGQRRNLIDRQKTLTRNQNILLQRQGQTVVNSPGENNINLESILAQIDHQRQQYSQELQKLESEISLLSAELEMNQEGIDHQNFVLDEKRQELRAIEAKLLNLQTTNYQCWGRVNLYQEALQPIQDCLDGLRDKLQVISNSLAHVQETGDSQIQTITEMRQTLQNLIPDLQLLAL